MASFALLPILSVFVFDLPHGKIGFDPIVSKDHFSCLWSLDPAWGQVEIQEGSTVIRILGGELVLSALELPYVAGPVKLRIDGAEVVGIPRDGTIYFEKTHIKGVIEVTYGQ